MSANTHSSPDIVIDISENIEYINGANISDNTIDAIPRIKDAVAVFRPLSCCAVVVAGGVC